MASAADQIAAPPKRSRAKVAPKNCGVAGCKEEVATGARLRLTVLESPTQYPAAIEGKISTCKAHRKCVGIQGYSTGIPEYDKIFKDCGLPADLGHFTCKIFQACGLPAKVFYIGRPFCESCHNTYLEALVTLIKPRLTSDQIHSVRDQISKDCKREVVAQPPPPPEEPKVKQAPPRQAAKKSATTSEIGGKIVVKKAATAAPPPPPPVADVEEESSESASRSASESEEEAQAPPPPPPPPKQPKVVKVHPPAEPAKAHVVEPSKSHPPAESAIEAVPTIVVDEDPFNAMEKALSKEDKAAAVVSGQQVPIVVKEPVKPAGPKTLKKTVAVKA